MKNETENDSVNEDVFWETVDAIVELANQTSEKADPGVAASAVMQAAARYCAFYAAASSESRKDLKDDKDVIVQDFTREFKKHFATNLEEYIEHYKLYIGVEE